MPCLQQDELICDNFFIDDTFIDDVDGDDDDDSLLNSIVRRIKLVTTPRNQSTALAPACLSMRLRRTHPRLDRRKVSRASQRRRSR